ncbi:MAG: sugar isomerase domain-containing protein [Actinobacteria bacterium]|nr:sugar isomerase domain-containing protein [Actinomycetota bacterium]
MLAQRYGQAVRAVFDEIDQAQMPAIQTAADWIARSLANGGAVHIFDTGHMLNHEAVGRSGGLMAITPLQVSVRVDHPSRPRPKAPKPRVFMDEIEGLAGFVVGKSDMYPGDVLMVGSVSGKNPLPVEVAIRAREVGIKVVAITSVPYSRFLQSQHKSGLRLFEVADLVLDIGGAVGDAAVDVPGLPVRFGPTSGLAASYINWLLQAAVVEKLLEMGLTPSVYMSNHMPGAGEFNSLAKKNFEGKGY